MYEHAVEGRSNQVTADLMCVAEKTVKFHMTGIFKKCAVTTRFELIAKHYKLQLELREHALKVKHAIEVERLKARIYMLEETIAPESKRTLPGRPLKGCA